MSHKADLAKRAHILRTELMEDTEMPSTERTAKNREYDRLVEELIEDQV